MASRLTHQEAERIVKRAQDLLDNLQLSAASTEPDESDLHAAIKNYVDQSANSLLRTAPQEVLQDGMQRLGQHELWKLAQNSIKIHPSPDVSRPTEQELLTKIDRYLRVSDAHHSAETIAPFVKQLSSMIEEANTGMRSGWWLFPSRTRSRTYETCRRISQLLESDAGHELERLAAFFHSAVITWEDVQRDLSDHSLRFEDVIRQAAPTVLAKEDRTAGLSDTQVSYAENLIQLTDKLLTRIEQAHAITSAGRQAVLLAIDLYLGSWADEIINAGPGPQLTVALRFYGKDRLRKHVQSRLQVNPSLLNEDPHMRRLITEGDRYRQLASAEKDLLELSASIESISRLRQKSSTIRQNLQWLLLSDSDRNDAIVACDKLNNLLASNEATRLQDRCDAIAKAQKTDWVQAKMDMKRSSLEIQSALKEVAPNSISDEDNVAGLTKVLEEQTALSTERASSLLEDVQRASETKPDTSPVKDAVTAYRKERVAGVIRQTPIDVINQGVRQFQIRGLKEAGYKTVGSILRVSAHTLEQIPGMGRGVASDAQRMARDYVSYQENETKVRLSLDDTSTVMDSLLTAIATYRAATSAQQLLRSSHSTISKLTELNSKAKKLRPDLAWVLTSQDNRDEISEAADELHTYLEGQEVQDLENSLTFIFGNRSVDNTQARNDFTADPIGFAGTLEQVVPNAIGSDNGAYGLSDKLAKKASAVKFSDTGLKVTLRPYQIWGVKFVLAQKRVLLGDEMGLGKTIQALGVMVALHAMGYRKFMVVCPLSVLENWDREIQSKSTLSPIKIYGQEWKRQYRLWRKSYDRVAVTTYETLAHLDTENLTVDLLVVDEAHYAKNPKAKRTQNLMRFVNISNYVLFMTGTALENKADEMVQLISMLQPDVARKAKDLVDHPFGVSYRNAIAPVYYRRKREDVLDELPELTENKEWCKLSEDEVGAYISSLEEGFMAARCVSWNVGDLSKSSKARRLKEIVEIAREDGRKVLIFSFFKKTLADVTKFLEPDCIGPISGSVSPKERQEMVDRFEEAPAGTALVAQIQAGGTGLNIQAASVVILCEPQYKPSIENQAISRAYRMGQTRKVFVHRLLCTNTIDERILEILANKQQIFNTFADRSVAAEQIDQKINRQTMDEIVREELEKYRGAVKR